MTTSEHMAEIGRQAEGLGLQEAQELAIRLEDLAKAVAHRAQARKWRELAAGHADYPGDYRQLAAYSEGHANYFLERLPDAARWDT